jgi:TonB family protein
MNNPAKIFSFEELLRDLSTRTDSGDYAEALALLEIASSSDPENIYIAALKRQLESLFNLDMQNQLDDDRRRELTDPLPGIIECAMREFNQPHLRPAHRPPAPPAPSPEDHASTEDSASKELEALKLLYFQRASKFVMRGEYEQALAEVQRVFVVDPENLIAKEYASRVEHLIDHARKLASEPIDDQTEDLPDAAPEVTLAAAPEDDPPSRDSRATAWDDNFLAAAEPLPEHPSYAPAHKQTVSYGDSLSAALENHPRSEDDEHAPRRSRKSLMMIAAVVVLFLGGGLAIVLSSLHAGAGEPPATPVAQTDNQAHVAAQGTAMIVSQHDGTPQQNPPATTNRSAVPAQKPAHTTEPPAEKPKVNPPPVTEEPAKQQPLAEASEPPKKEEPVAVAVPEPKPADVEVPAPPPAFVAVEKEPQIINLVKPQFPGFVWKTAGEGQVVIKVHIDAGGNPTDTQILKSSNVVFEEGVKDAVMKSRFAPAQMGQGPVAAWLTIPFRFKQPR